MIPCYNCSTFLIEAICSVLKQDPGPEIMQIEVVDDASTDSDVQSLVERWGKGRVNYFRQQENVGSLRNFETCLNRSTGYYIHLLHADDLVLPGFYKKMEDAFALSPSAGAAFTGFTHIDQNGEVLFHNKALQSVTGIIPNWLFRIGKAQLTQVVATVVKREVYEKVGGFYGVHYGEDWEMWVRIAAAWPVIYIPDRLAHYRVHENNITGRYFLSGQSMRDVEKVIESIQQYFPPARREEMKKLAQRHFAHYFAMTTDKIYHEYARPDIALQQAANAVKMHRCGTTLYYYFKIYGKMRIGYKLKKSAQLVASH